MCIIDSVLFLASIGMCVYKRLSVGMFISELVGELFIGSQVQL